LDSKGKKITLRFHFIVFCANIISALQGPL
jgi:hypothetical protein